MFFLLGGVWLSLLYGAMVVPATVWQIQLTIKCGLKQGILNAVGLSVGQAVWGLAAALLVFEFKSFWQWIDPGLRMAAFGFLIWMAWRVKGSRPLLSLGLNEEYAFPGMGMIIWRSFSMPLRFPLWLALLVSISVHLRGPGWGAALLFGVGSVLGLFLWYSHFMIVAYLFGKRVPEPITLKSMNKLRVLAFAVLLGLAILVIAPMLLV